MYDGGGKATLTNVTISSSFYQASSIYNESSDITLTNVIIWRDKAGTTSTSASTFFNDFGSTKRSYSLITNSGGSTKISYSLIANSGGSGAGWQSDLGTDLGNNIDIDPQFLTGGDYRLQVGSPAIDVGNNRADLDAEGAGTTTISDIATDLAGSPRIRNGTVDMGAYEAAPQLGVLGLGMSITDGVTTTNSADGTDFGTVLVGETMTHTFTISNTDSLTLSVSLPITLSNSTDFAISTPPATIIPPESSSSFEVTFSPSTTDTFTSTLEIGRDDSGQNPFDFVIGGSGIAPEISVQGSGVSIASGDTIPSISNGTDFDSLLVNSTMTHTFTISNTGSSPLNLSLPITLSDSTHFTMTRQPTATIAASSSSAFEVEFAPTATGFHTTTISIASDDHDETSYTFVLGGLGTVPPPPNNQGPVLHQAIPDITVDEGAAGQLINLLDYFSDPENDTLFFRIIENSNREVLPNLLPGQQLSDNLLSLQFGVPGQTTITIQAVEFATGRTFHDDFIVTVQALPTLSIADVTIVEGSTRALNATATFLVTLSPTSAQPVTVAYTTVAGSATADDYSAISGTLTIPPGETTGTLSVPIIDDELAEPDETFTMQLTNATNATISDGEATATISANDMAPTSVTLASLSAQGKSATWQIGVYPAGMILLTLLVACGWLAWLSYPTAKTRKPWFPIQ